MILDAVVRGHRLHANKRPLVMGILNVTPDSFSDGGRHSDVEAAVSRAFSMQEEGADLVDVGGESTRPGAEPVSVEEEMRRLLPVLERLQESGYSLPVSVDTRRAEVAKAAVQRGACMVNDVSAFSDPEMAGVVADSGAAAVLMHMRGVPADMQDAPAYEEVVAEVSGFLAAARDRALEAGVKRDRLVLDPGIGFGKRTGHGVEDNATLLSRLPEFGALGQPILVGASRKRFIGSITGARVGERLPGSLAAAMAAAWGGASLLRVHDVAATLQAVRLAAHLDPSRWQTWWQETSRSRPSSRGDQKAPRKG